MSRTPITATSIHVCKFSPYHGSWALLPLPSPSLSSSLAGTLGLAVGTSPAVVGAAVGAQVVEMATEPLPANAQVGEQNKYAALSAVA
jgi:hypothetical protein